MSKQRFNLTKMIRILGGCSGSALVETALTLPMLLGILLGGAELGRVAYVAIEVQNAARAAAQYAAMNGGAFNSNDSSGLDTTGMLNAAKADSGNLGGLSTVAFASTPTFSCSCTGTGTASCIPPSSPSGCTTSHLLVTVTVKMKASYTSTIQLGAIPSQYTLYGNSIEQVLQ
jgi:Flp pilus assembly protein TadG